MSTTYTHNIKQKIVAFAIVLVTSFVLSSFAFAETTATTSGTVAVTTTAATTATPTIAALMEQLAKLTALFNQLKSQLMTVQSDISALRAGIKEGASGEDVRTIQEILASDRTIYPAGLKTGFFGPMTTEAIKRFQTANGLEVTGIVDEATKAAFDTIIEQRKVEGKIPMGLLMAPGLRDKFEGRLKAFCDHATASSTTGARIPMPCMHIGEHPMTGKPPIKAMCINTMPHCNDMINGNHDDHEDMNGDDDEDTSDDDENEDDGDDDNEDDDEDEEDSH